MAGENDKPCPCGHPTEVNGQPFETLKADGLCSDREDHAAGAQKCKCHDSAGRKILRPGTPEAFALQAREAAAADAAKSAEAPKEG